jgi:hypothetical protein
MIPSAYKIPQGRQNFYRTVIKYTEIFLTIIQLQNKKRVCRSRQSPLSRSQISHFGLFCCMRSYLQQMLHFLILLFRQFIPGHLIVPLLHHTVPSCFGCDRDPIVCILYSRLLCRISDIWEHVKRLNFYNSVSIPILYGTSPSLS